MRQLRLSTKGTRKPTVGTLALAGIAAVFLASASAASQAPPKNEIPSDVRIAEAVEKELASDSAVPVHRIEVTTRNGVVRLRGRVDHILARERAVRITETVRGVRSIVNEIQVIPREDWTDEAIRASVHNALVVDQATGDYDLSIEVDDGRVTLVGRVDSYQAKELAEQVAKSVAGVTGIDNEMVVDYETDRPDSEIQDEVESALHWDVLVEDALIAVDVQDGAVSLVGNVGSLAEKRRAASRAWVAGVRDVDVTELEIEPWAEDSQRSAEVLFQTDAEVREAVEDALTYDPRVNPMDVTTTVTRGIVTLRGAVDSLKARQAAGQDARNTVGVERVFNRLVVREYGRTDEDIRSQITTTLVHDPVVERYELGVQVDDGFVTLTGEVGSYFEKAQAEDIASKVAGVDGIKNRIAVDPHETPDVYNPYVDEHYLRAYEWYGKYHRSFTLKSDAEIRKDVEEQLWWSPFVDAEAVEVAVEDGVVTLTGEVDTWAQRDAATENAFDGGAVIVDNDLVIRSAPPPES